MFTVIIWLVINPATLIIWKYFSSLSCSCKITSISNAFTLKNVKHFDFNFTNRYNHKYWTTCIYCGKHITKGTSRLQTGGPHAWFELTVKFFIYQFLTSYCIPAVRGRGSSHWVVSTEVSFFFFSGIFSLSFSFSSLRAWTGSRTCRSEHVKPIETFNVILGFTNKLDLTSQGFSSGCSSFPPSGERDASQAGCSLWLFHMCEYDWERLCWTAYPFQVFLCLLAKAWRPILSLNREQEHAFIMDGWMTEGNMVSSHCSALESLKSAMFSCNRWSGIMSE